MSTQENKRNLEWGLLLISFGIAALLGSFSFATDWMKIGVLALGGLAGLVIYLLDRSDWVLLIPPYILLVAAGISSLALLGFAEGEFFASFVLLMIALPFLVVYLQNRTAWWALIPAWVLLVVGAIIAVEELGWIGGSWIATFILGSIALPFLVVFFIDRNNWWALIPFYVLASLALMIPLIETRMLNEGWIATYILGSVGLPFLIVYLRDREQWWGLIPAYVMLALGVMIGLITEHVLVGLVIPSYIMLAVAFPFFVVYLLDRKQGWALIPGFITGVMGLLFLIGTEFFQYIFPAVMILLGLWVLFKAIQK